jgi:hypothetical protein
MPQWHYHLKGNCARVFTETQGPQNVNARRPTNMGIARGWLQLSCFPVFGFADGAQVEAENSSKIFAHVHRLQEEGANQRRKILHLKWNCAQPTEQLLMHIDP